MFKVLFMDFKPLRVHGLQHKAANGGAMTSN